jgi:DNA repair exonuclease SbcCD ATPase subunit
VTEESGKRPVAGAAASAAERLRAIVEAAERSAAELEAAAREEAERVRSGAEREADEQIARVREAGERLMERADAIERELDQLAEGLRTSIAALVESVRRSAETLGGELEELRAELARARGGEARGESPPAPTDAVPPGQPRPAAIEEATAEPLQASEPAAAGPEGARVIALNMALRGASREETASYLAENFELDDPDALLDDVYARAGG